MCHLAVEKSLKGLYYEKRRELPPKTHCLVYLLNELGIKPPEELGRFIVKLSEASVPARYPEDLAQMHQIYTNTVVSDILSKAEEVIVWIKELL